MKNLLIFLGIIFIIAALSLWFWGMATQFPIEFKDLTIAELGDWLGGSTAALINIAGFIMLYLAFSEQQKATQQATKNFSIQKFETTFFNLLNLHYQNIHRLQNSFSVDGSKNFFEVTRQFLIDDVNGETELTVVKKSYQKYYNIHLSDIDQFIRHLILITEYVDTTKVFDIGDKAKEEKKAYFNILFSQLSTNELFLIFYHTSFFDNSFKSKLKNYNLLDRLKRSNILIDENHWSEYTK